MEGVEYGEGRVFVTMVLLVLKPLTNPPHSSLSGVTDHFRGHQEQESSLGGSKVAWQAKHLLASLKPVFVCFLEEPT